MLGIGRDRLRQVRVLPGDREDVDVAALDAELACLGGRPAIVVANAGTVNTVDFDDLRAIAAQKEQHTFWLHVDAAFGCFAALSPRHAHLAEGLDAADSICDDLQVAPCPPTTRASSSQAAASCSSRCSTTPYLGLPAGEPDFLHLTPENSRRLRALPAWFSPPAYGRAGHREVVERNVELARRLGARVEGLPTLSLRAPVRLDVVCFALAEDPTQERVEAPAGAVTASGEAFLTPAVFGGAPALRAAFSNWRTTEVDTERVITALAAAV
ncbi:aspartate aminotransferase family protein [Streptomyces sp. AC555_RSS877]|uniref:pyridoxal phosphate-dependent decarboxylase family protein n=1 Tax=Streptomyces sp. AC555_RSS877 TaxID=2823688 RepID=UPI001C27C723|nr:pyridoxal-dependent decarboxylase [Streptomyces sp. AC555_RSS877]